MVHSEIIVGAALAASKAYSKGLEYCVKKAVEWVINCALPGIGAALAKLSGALDYVVGVCVQVIEWILEKVGVTPQIVGVFIGVHIE